MHKCKYYNSLVLLKCVTVIILPPKNEYSIIIYSRLCCSNQASMTFFVLSNTKLKCFGSFQYNESQWCPKWYLLYSGLKDMRVSENWQNFNYWVSFPFKVRKWRRKRRWDNEKEKDRESDALCQVLMLCSSNLYPVPSLGGYMLPWDWNRERKYIWKYLVNMILL